MYSIRFRTSFLVEGGKLSRRDVAVAEDGVCRRGGTVNRGLFVGADGLCSGRVGVMTVGMGDWWWLTSLD